MVVAVAFAMTFISCNPSSNEDIVSLIPVLSGEKWGYINKKGEFIINPQFSDAGFFRNGLARIVSTEGKVGYIDNKGQIVIPAKYDAGTHFYEGLAFVVEQGGKPTCIDIKGEPKFVLSDVEKVFSFSCGLAFVIKEKNETEWININGANAISSQYDYHEQTIFGEDLIPVRFKEGKDWGVMDNTGKIVINPQFNEIGNFKEGKAWFYNGEQYGFIDTKGKYIINPQFEYCSDFSEGLASFRQGSVYGFIDEEGKIVINPQFEKVGNFKNGYALIRQGKKWGYINRTGKISINPQFDMASDFFGDIAFVKIDKKWGIINKDGDYVVTPQFNNIKNQIEEYGYVENDYYDLSEFENKFFNDTAKLNYKNFLGKTVENLVENEIYRASIKSLFSRKNVIWKEGCDVSGFRLNEIRFSSDEYLYSYGYYNDEYNDDAIIKSVVYEFSFTTEKQKTKSEKIYDKLVKYIEDNYNLNNTGQVNKWTVICTSNDGTNIKFSMDTKKGTFTFSFTQS